MERVPSSQRHKHLLRRQRGGLPPPAQPDDEVSSVVVSLGSDIASPSDRPGAGKGRGPADIDNEEEEAGGQGGRPLSSCSVTCLATHLGSDCRTVSCMCNSPDLGSANTCIAAACPIRDRGVFLTNIQAWCGNDQAVALLSPGASASPASTTAARDRSSTAVSSAETSTIASEVLSSDASTISSEASSSEVSTAPSTARGVSTRTTTLSASTAEDLSLETGRVNSKLGNGNNIASPNDPDFVSSPSDGSNANQEGSTGEKKGVSGGTIAGIVIGMILAFIIIGGCAWFIRKAILGRTKKGKQFLRSSDPGDWVNQDAGLYSHHNNNAAGSGTGDEDMNEKSGMDEDRIERTMQQRAGSMVSSQTVRPGIGAFVARTSTLPPTPHTSSASEFGLCPNAGNRQSQRQYQDMHDALAYPSHMGIAPSSPYHTHPQHYSSHPQAHFSSSSATPHASMQSMNTHTPCSAGMESNMANLSHRDTDSLQGSPYPESITMTPETSHASSNNNDKNGFMNASQLGRHQSIPFIIPSALQAANAVETRQQQYTQHQNHPSYSGSMNNGTGVPRSLTAGHGDSRLSTSPQNRLTQQMAQGVPLPMSPPTRNASLPMALPGMAMSMQNEGAGTSSAVSDLKGKDGPEQIPSENPFLDIDEEEGEGRMDKKKKRESFEGLAYLAQ